jgi:predicted nucleotidyltransferase
MSAVAELADDLGVNERTLRRAWAAEMIHGSRPTPYRLRIPVGERAYLRRHWATLSRLRQTLRTERNVSLAVIFGSVARGDDDAASDIDLLIALRQPSLASTVALDERLRERTRLPIEVVELQDAMRHPLLLAEILRDGRVLADRDGQWAQLQAKSKAIRTEAEQERQRLAERAHEAVIAFERRMDADR